MADSPLVNNHLQKLSQEDQQDQQTAATASSYGGSGTPSGGGLNPGGYGGGLMDQGNPGYSGGGARPHTDNGFTQYVSHMHGAGVPRTGRYTQGPYKGMDIGEAQEAMHDDWLKMAPEARAPFYQREFGADTVDPNNPSGFFSQAQKDQYAPGFDKDFGALQQRTGAAPAQGSSGINPNYSTPSPQAFAQSAGSINDGPARVDYGAQPSYHQADAIPPGGVVPHPQFQVPASNNFNSTNPQFRSDMGMNNMRPGGMPQMGNPMDVARYGPVMTGGGSVAQATAAGANPAYQPPQQPRAPISVTPAPALASVR